MTTCPVVMEKMLLCVLVLRQANSTMKEIAETTKTGLRTFQHVIKACKDNGEPSSSGKIKILNDRDRRSLKRL